MLKVETIIPEWTAQEHLRVISILKNSNPVGYINKGPDDSWETILNALQKSLSSSLTNEQSIPE